MEHVENLERRVNALEQELGSLRDLIACQSPARPTCKVTANHERANSGMNQNHLDVALAGNAPGIDGLRALLAAHGIHPGNEIVQQEIADMREQEEDS